MRREQKKYEDDDGRVICNMDVEGMRWHGRRAPREKSAPKPVRQGLGAPMSASEARRYTWSAVLAGLAVASVFSITWVLFVLFCTEVWFR